MQTSTNSILTGLAVADMLVMLSLVCFYTEPRSFLGGASHGFDVVDGFARHLEILSCETNVSPLVTQPKLSTCDASSNYIANSLCSKLQPLPTKRNHMSSQQPSDRTTRMLLSVLLLFLITEFPSGILGLLSGIIGDVFYTNVFQPLGEIFDILATPTAIVSLITDNASKDYSIGSEKIASYVKTLQSIPDHVYNNGPTIITTVDELFENGYEKVEKNVALRSRGERNDKQEDNYGKATVIRYEATRKPLSFSEVTKVLFDDEYDHQRDPENMQPMRKANADFQSNERGKQEQDYSDEKTHFDNNFIHNILTKLSSQLKTNSLPDSGEQYDNSGEMYSKPVFLIESKKQLPAPVAVSLLMDLQPVTSAAEQHTVPSLQLMPFHAVENVYDPRESENNVKQNYDHDSGKMRSSELTGVAMKPRGIAYIPLIISKKHISKICRHY
ncbi:sex peptide receptor-like isoform X2, partial [Dinothrombium tinctorium]